MSPLRKVARGIALAISLCLICGSAVVAASPKQFFLNVPLAKSASTMKPAGVVSQASPVAFNAGEMLSLNPGEVVELTLPNGVASPVVFERGVSHGGGINSWVGYFQERGINNRVIITSGPNGSYGVIDTPTGSYRIIPGDGYDWLVDMEKEKPYIPPRAAGNDARPAPASIVPPQGADRPDLKSGVATKSATLPLIDLMVVVTDTLASQYGSTLMTRLYFLITRANTVYSDSGMSMTLRLVNLAVVHYPDSGDDETALDAVTPTGGGGTGVFANIEAQRTASGADLVSFMRNGSAFGGSGIAWVPTNVNFPTSFSSNLMYSVVTGCTAGCEEVFIHELGHNFGNNHDRYTEAWQNGTSAPAPQDGSYSYSFGYVYCAPASPLMTCTPNIGTMTQGTCSASQPECTASSNDNFRDIMAYFQGSTQQIFRFSNPNLMCATTNGTGTPQPCGVADAASNSADNAHSMSNTASFVSAVKAKISADPMPGSIQFTQTSFGGSPGGSVTFTVSRMRDAANGSTGGGAVSVNYSLTPGSATAGVDYTTTSGTLNWADGDFANKTFSVTLLSGSAGPIVSFTATLSSPAGAAGVFLGYPGSASGVVQKTWPPGGTVPAGWTNPSGAAWAVASDSANDPDGTSLKSGAMNFSALNCGGNPCPSVLQYSGTFLAGTIGFAYRVSGFPGFGFIDFIVDGTTVFSGTGSNATADSGWQSTSVPVTAGAHTIAWQYRTTIPYLCSTAYFTPPPPYPSCADRAWIDDVSLPLLLPASSTGLATNANPSVVGQLVTFTATVSGSAGTPTGTVAFLDGSALIVGCEAITMTSGSAACATSALAAGAHSITAAYSGSATYAASVSAAVSQTVNSTVLLTVTKTGSGSGTVNSSPAGISCGGTCSASVTAGSQITLGASAGGGSVFTGWSGGTCTGIGPCTFNPAGATTVTATFALLAGTPTAAASPVSIDFGGASQDTTSLPLVVSVLNVGTGTLTVTGISASDPQFAQTNNCTTLGTGANCTITLTFTPTLAAAAGATLNIQTSGGTLAVPLAGLGEHSLVTHYYNAILNRAPDTSGKAFWEGEAARMQGLGADLREAYYVMAGYFFSSAEYQSYGKSDTQFVTDLYNTFFNRPPDSGGLGYWTGQIAGGLPREVVLFSFMFSTEFQTFTTNIFGNTAARPEVNLVMDFFRGILNRLPDSTAYTYWVGQLKTAQCQGAGAVYTMVDNMSYTFIFGAEYSNRARNNTQYVTDLYYSFLRRGGDINGVNYWITQLNTAALDRNGERGQFIASPEFGARVTSVINAGCVP